MTQQNFTTFAFQTANMEEMSNQTVLFQLSNILYTTKNFPPVRIAYDPPQNAVMDLSMRLYEE